MKEKMTKPDLQDSKPGYVIYIVVFSRYSLVKSSIWSMMS